MTTKSKIIRETAKHLGIPCVDISRTQTKRSPPVLAKDKWPELQEWAVIIANQACDKVNHAAHVQQLKQPCQYPAQCTLELLIDELQRRV